MIGLFGLFCFGYTTSQSNKAHRIEILKKSDAACQKIKSEYQETQFDAEQGDKNPRLIANVKQVSADVTRQVRIKFGGKIMKTKITSTVLVIILSLVGLPNIFAQNNDWEGVKKLNNQEIAVEKTNGEKVFGLLNSVDDTEITIQIADKNEVSNTKTTIGKGEIKKLWLATLHFGKRNTAKGALIGAGVGAAVGVGVYAVTKNAEDADGLEILVVPVVVIAATGLGAVVGFFSKKGHKRGKLIYRV